MLILATLLLALGNVGLDLGLLKPEYRLNNREDNNMTNLRLAGRASATCCWLPGRLTRDSMAISAAHLKNHVLGQKLPSKLRSVALVKKK